MSQSLSKLNIHIAFAVKDRARVFLTIDVRERVARYIAGVLKSMQCYPIAVGCAQEHVHIACIQSKNVSTAQVVAEVKKSSSRWIKTIEQEIKDPGLMKFRWQNGYAAFSVSESNVDIVARYIRNQDEHHRHISFREEYGLFLAKHNVNYDERYVWD